MALYFAFGSNLDPSRMLARVPGACFLSEATLPDHRLVFCARPGPLRPGVADVQAAPGFSVPGMLIDLPPGGLEDLDVFEGAPRVYRRVFRCVNTRRGPRWAVAYVMPTPGHPRVPDPDYYGRISAGYSRWRLSRVPLDRALATAARADRRAAPDEWVWGFR
jgi:gamma-glutamylcyclotransferase (GGCT)/AIG2-like uncharacterized protein YtfP